MEASVLGRWGKSGMVQQRSRELLPNRQGRHQLPAQYYLKRSANNQMKHTGRYYRHSSISEIWPVLAQKILGQNHPGRPEFASTSLGKILLEEKRIVQKTIKWHAAIPSFLWLSYWDQRLADIEGISRVRRCGARSVTLHAGTSSKPNGAGREGIKEGKEENENENQDLFKGMCVLFVCVCNQRLVTLWCKCWWW